MNITTWIRIGMCLAVLGTPLATKAAGQTSVGQVMAHAKISDTAGGFGGVLTNNDDLGWAVANLGDIDGDGNRDVAVGAPGDDDGNVGAGAVYILFLDAFGGVISEQKISATSGGFGGTLGTGDAFGSALANLGDLNGDGIDELAVGAPTTDDGGPSRGAAWILFLDASGMVANERKISDIAGGFSLPLVDGDWFGMSVDAAGDINGDTVPDMIVGAPHDADGGPERGAAYLITLQPNGQVLGNSKISQLTPSFAGTLTDFGRFGYDVAGIGDIDGNGALDFAVGTPDSDEGGGDRGAVWILRMTPFNTILAHTRISDTSGGFAGTLDDIDHFGRAVSGIDDIDHDGTPDILVGAELDDDGGDARGAVWVILLNPGGSVKGFQKISDTEGNFGGTLDDWDEFGRAVDGMGDWNGNGFMQVIVGAPRDDDGGDNRGAAWILSLRPDVWTALGTGKPGAGGLVPLLEGFGSLEAGDPVNVALSQARPSSITTLVIGLSTLNAPFMGGTLVPDVDILISGLPISAGGQLPLPGTWPAGVPAGFKFYFQHWIVDPAATFNLSASNGLLGVATGP